jgi:hypothetical protein
MSDNVPDNRWQAALGSLLRSPFSERRLGNAPSLRDPNRSSSPPPSPHVPKASLSTMTLVETVDEDESVEEEVWYDAQPTIDASYDALGASAPNDNDTTVPAAPSAPGSRPPRHGRRAANAVPAPRITPPIDSPIKRNAGTSGDAVEEPIRYKKLKHLSLLPLNNPPSEEAVQFAERNAILLEEQRVRELESEAWSAEAHRLFFETAPPESAAQPSAEAEDEKKKEFIPGAGVKSFMLLFHKKADPETSFDPAVKNFLRRTKGPVGPETEPSGTSVRILFDDSNF